MKPELREQLGKATWQSEIYHHPLRNTWDTLPEAMQEQYCDYGEAAVTFFVQMVMPIVQNLRDIIVPTLTEAQQQQLQAVLDHIKATVGE